MHKRLTRSITDKMLFGVCGGIAQHYGWDSSLLRILFVIVTLLGIGSPVIIYIVLAIIMPRSEY
jgi:phage shock protein C